MKKLYLHIGLGKTGSSALQSWLSLNAGALASQGIDYADTVPEAKYGESLSGNGSMLHQACVDLDFDEVERLLTSTYFFTPGNDVAIISCELFQGTRPAAIARFREICERNGIDVTVIAYVRSAYEGLYSTYLQFVKRSDCTHSFGDGDSDTTLAVQVSYLRRYLDVFGDNMIVLNYDGARKDIYTSFAGVTGIETRGMKKLEARVNRSLSTQETEVLRRINALHHGVFSTPISNFVIGLAPNVETPVLYRRHLVEQVRSNTESDVRWINEQFNLSPPLVTDYYPGRDSPELKPLTLASYRPVLQWALEYTPDASRTVNFVSFLREFAAYLVEMSDKNALALLRRANRIGTDLAPDAPAEGDKPVPTEPPRSRYLMIYLQDYTLPESNEFAEFSGRWDEWVDLIADHAVGCTHNPLVDAQLLNARKTVPPATRPLASGFSIIEVNDWNIALSLAKACPLLDIGGSVEVSSIVSLYGATQPCGAPGNRVEIVD
jgi:hypothetical protein